MIHAEYQRFLQILDNETDSASSLDETQRNRGNRL